MKTIIKVIAFVIDIALMPLRLLLGLEIVIAGAIMADSSIKDSVKVLLDNLKEYPNIVKKAAEMIFD